MTLKEQHAKYLAAGLVYDIWDRLNFPRGTQLIKQAQDHGFDLPQEEVIHIFCGGSNLHGAKDDSGKSDLDICGIFVESPELALGIDRDEHFISKTAAEGERNQSGDKDFTIYSLRKWAAMACNGNPNAPLFLFAPVDPKGQTTVWDAYIRPSAHLFLAKTTLVGDYAKGGLLGFAKGIWKRAEAALRGKEYHEAGGFLGFARNMLYRMQGKRGRGKKGQRPELELKFGYDTKAAMHMIRAMFEAIELVETGKLAFPNRQVETLKAIRRGEWSKTVVEQYFEQLESELKKLVRKSDLRKEIDRAAVSKLVSRAYLAHWRQREFFKRSQ
jgi:predicted nucleotidyltransferase